MKKTESLPSTSALFTCTRCGRVGERGSTQIDAKARWNAKRYKYGPLKEEEE